MRISSAGLVGIGTSSPDTKLVSNYGTVTTFNSADIRTISAMLLTASDPGTTSASHGVALTFRPIQSRGAVVSIVGYNENANKEGTGVMAFLRGGSTYPSTMVESMRIDNNGNVGIGGSPGFKLQVFGAQNANDIVITNTTINSSLRMQMIDAYGSIFTNGSYPLMLGTNSAERMRIDSSGNVGIGTASPTSKLDITDASGGAPSLRIVNSAAGAWLRLTGTSGSSSLIDANGLMLFRTGASYTTALTIDASQNIGLGVTPSAWATAYRKVLQLFTGGSISGGDGPTFVSVAANTYLDSTPVYKYISTGQATRFEQQSGEFSWHTAASGTAGGAVTFTQAMTLTASRELLLGTTTSYSGRFVVVPSAVPTTVAGANQIQIGENSSNTGYRLQLGYLNGTHGWAGSIQAYAGGAATNLVLQGVGGKIGIGATDVRATLQIGSSFGGGNVPSTSKLLFGADNSIITFLSANDGVSTDGVISSYNTVYAFENARVSFDKPAGNLGQLSFWTQNGSGITERLRINNAGAFGLSGANYGSSGQVLTSGGSGATPTWTTVGGGSPAGSTGQFQYNNAGAFAAAPAMMTTAGTNVRFNPTSTNKLQFFSVDNSADSIQFFTGLQGPYYYSLENHISSPYMGLVWGNSNWIPAGWGNLMSFMNMSVGIGTKAPNATLQVVGSLSKSSGSFCIDHPLPSMTETHNLVHSFVEAPDADLMYSGMVNLVNGLATVNIDTASRMTEGTFVLLCRNVRRFCSNEGGWTPIRSTIVGNILTIEAQDATCSDEIFWQVIGERCDKHMIDTGWTDEEGRVIVEPLKIKPTPEGQTPYPQATN
jgi:hypothetical protein